MGVRAGLARYTSLPQNALHIHTRVHLFDGRHGGLELLADPGTEPVRRDAVFNGDNEDVPCRMYPPLGERHVARFTHMSDQMCLDIRILQAEPALLPTGGRRSWAHTAPLAVRLQLTLSRRYRIHKWIKGVLLGRLFLPRTGNDDLKCVYEFHLVLVPVIPQRKEPAESFIPAPAVHKRWPLQPHTRSAHEMVPRFHQLYHRAEGSCLRDVWQ
mmetsp:Transcript_29090/g.81418  ORF Transcript_29090/g.81418 Transcript_29090/m.81418 type:complete len:213 (-) Transcript_29090:569-1207(-)